MNKVARTAILMLAALFAFGSFAVAYANGAKSDDVAAKREEDAREVAALGDDGDDDDTSDDDDGGGDDSSSFTSGVNSNDRTGSGHSKVSRDRDRSRGDNTRDRTRDGKGGKKRDWSANHTNDRSRNDTR
jgi:hypothetical protein